MGRLPQFKRFSIEDFQGQKDWIDNLLSPMNQFMNAVVGALNQNITVSENLLQQLSPAVVTTRSSYSTGQEIGCDISKTFVDANVNTTTNRVTVTAHGFPNGHKCQLTTTGVLPGGLASSKTYFISVVDANTFRFSDGGADIDITSAAGGGTHTVTLFEDLPPYAKLISPVKIKVTMKVKPIGLIIVDCKEDATNPSTMLYGVTADWFYSDGLVTINAISGLSTSKTYDLQILLIGG